MTTKRDMIMESNEPKSEKNELVYHVPKGWVRFLYTYYFLLIAGGIAFMLNIILMINLSHTASKITGSDYVMYTFFVSMLASAVFSSICYSKKLYKACIDGRLLFVNTNRAIIIGNIWYFFLRPIFAVAFSVLFVVCLLGGVLFLMNGLDCAINERMVYLSAIISSAIGYSVGNLLDKFSIVSEKTITKIQ